MSESAKKGLKEVKLRYLLDDYSDDPDTVQALSMVAEVAKPPFTVPPEFYWPRGKKANSLRAAILMRCGLRYLKDKFHEEVDISTTSRQEAVASQASRSPLDAL